jgi:hypothetical protein
MPISVYKGGIAGGSISARFQSDYSNVGSDLLAISYAEIGGANPQVDHAAAVPGGFATVGVQTTKAGVMEVWIAAGHENDSGRLIVTQNGTSTDDEPVQGSVRWVYSVGAV